MAQLKKGDEDEESWLHTQIISFWEPLEHILFRELPISFYVVPLDSDLIILKLRILLPASSKQGWKQPLFIYIRTIRYLIKNARAFLESSHNRFRDSFLDVLGKIVLPPTSLLVLAF